MSRRKKACEVVYDNNNTVGYVIIYLLLPFIYTNNLFILRASTAHVACSENSSLVNGLFKLSAIT